MQVQLPSILIDPSKVRNLDISISLYKLYYQVTGYHRSVNHLYEAAQNAGYNFSFNEVQNWLERQAMHQIHKPRPRYIPQASYNKIIHPNEVHQADVLYMPYDKVGNITYPFCLNVIDVASRYKASVPIGAVHVENLEGILTSHTIARALKKIYEDVTCSLIWPKLLQVDRGSEFKGKVINLMKEKGVKIWVGITHKHQCIVERFNHTLAEKLFEDVNTIWVKNLSDIVNELNNSDTRLLDITPVEAIRKDQVYALPSKICKNKPVGMDEICLPAGSLVRYLLDNSDYKGGKKRATDPNWSTKIFTIESSTIINGQPIMYRLSNISNKKIFIREELLLVPPDTMLPPAYILHNK